MYFYEMMIAAKSKLVRSYVISLTAALVVLLLTSLACKAQNTSSASASVSATVVSPVGLVKLGDVALQNLQRSLPEAETNASFSIIGSSVDAYNVSVSPSVSLQTKQHAETISATTSATLSQQNNSNNTLRINATFALAQNQQPGLYTSQNLEVIVGYN